MQCLQTSFVTELHVLTNGCQLCLPLFLRHLKKLFYGCSHINTYLSINGICVLKQHSRQQHYTKVGLEESLLILCVCFRVCMCMCALEQPCCQHLFLFVSMSGVYITCFLTGTICSIYCSLWSFIFEAVLNRQCLS